MMKKADHFRSMAADKLRQAEAAWNPHVMRQCRELAKDYERRAKLEERRSLAGDDEERRPGTQWPRIQSPGAPRAANATELRPAVHIGGPTTAGSWAR